MNVNDTVRTLENTIDDFFKYYNRKSGTKHLIVIEGFAKAIQTEIRKIKEINKRRARNAIQKLYSMTDEEIKAYIVARFEDEKERIEEDMWDF